MELVLGVARLKLEAEVERWMAIAAGCWSAPPPRLRWQ
jgi:hypothetical protein